MALRCGLLCPLALAASVATARADAPLSRVRLDARGPTEADALAERLLAQGYDVVPAPGGRAVVEVVVSEAEAVALRGQGYSLAVVARGAPAARSETWRKYPRFAEILAHIDHEHAPLHLQLRAGPDAGR